MKVAIISLFLIALAFLGLGTAWDANARGAEDRMGATLPYLLGAVLLVIDILLFIGWALWRL